MKKEEEKNRIGNSLGNQRNNTEQTKWAGPLPLAGCTFGRYRPTLAGNSIRRHVAPRAHPQTDSESILRHGIGDALIHFSIFHLIIHIWNIFAENPLK